MIKKIFKNTISFSISTLLTKIIGVFVIILITRYLGSTDFGKYSFALSLTALFAIFIDFGFNSVVIRDLAKDKSLTSKYVNNIITMKIVFSIIGLLVLSIILFLSKQKDMYFVVFMVYIFAILASFIGFFRSVYQSHEKMIYYTITTVIEKIAWLILVIISIKLDLGFKTMISLITVSSFIGFISSIIIIHKKFAHIEPSFDKKFISHMFKESLPFMMIGVFVLIYFKIDTIMLTYMKNYDIVGWYSSAYKFIDTLILIPTIIVGVMYPVLSRQTNKDKIKFIYRKLTRYLLILAIPITIGIFMLADKIVILLFGLQFQNTILATKILILVIPILFITYFLGTVLASLGKQNIAMYATAACAIFNIILNFILIPQFKLFEGAAIATVATELLALIIQYYYVRKEIDDRIEIYFYFKLLLINSILAIFLYITKDQLNILIIILLTIIIYFSLLILFKIIDKYEFDVIKKITNKNETNFDNNTDL